MHKIKKHNVKEAEQIELVEEYDLNNHKNQIHLKIGIYF